VSDFSHPTTRSSAAAPSRRALVRAGLWTAPTLVVAVAAPAAAATSGGTLSVQGGTSYAAKLAPDNTWECTLSNLTITTSGSSIAAGTLTLQVSFIPDATTPSFTQLNFRAGAPAGFTSNAPGGGVLPSTIYTYQLPIPANGTVSIPFGTWFSTWQPNNLQQGTFVLAASAPNFTPATWTLHAPTTTTSLTIVPGTSARATRSDGKAGIQFAGFGITLTGGSSGVYNNLALVTTWVPNPAAPSQATNIWVNGVPPTSWTGPFNVAQSPVTWTALLLRPSAAPYTLNVANGLYFWTNLVATQQYGTFEVRASLPGYTPAVWRVGVPAP
jgi:hypothetical protein